MKRNTMSTIGKTYKAHRAVTVARQ